MKSCLLGLLLVLGLIDLFSSHLLAQSTGNTLFPICKNNLFGYVDESGNIVIAPKFDSVQFFSHGLAAVRYNLKFGYIKPDGTWQIKPTFLSATEFQQFGQPVPVARVIDEKNRTHLINKKGRTKKGKRFFYFSSGIIRGCLRTMIIDPNLFFVRNFSGYDLVYRYSHWTGSPQVLTEIDTLPLQADTVIGFTYNTILIQKNNKFAFLRLPQKRINIDATAYTDYQAQARHEMFNQINFNYDDVVYSRIEENDEVWYAVVRTQNRYFLINGIGQHVNQIPYLSVRYLFLTLAFVEYETGNFGFVDMRTRHEYFKRTAPLTRN